MIAQTSSTTQTAAASPASLGAQRALSSLRELGRAARAEDPRAVRTAAGQLVSQLFFAPLLAEARKLPFGKDVGNGGRGEEVFGEQLDQRLADTLASQARSTLSRLIEQRLGQPAQPGQA